VIAVVPVRNGELPDGGDEAVGEAGGRVVLIGSDVAEAASGLAGVAVDVFLAEAGAFAPASWAGQLAKVLVDEQVVLLPGSPDGRDLAPRLADRLDRPLLSGAIEAHDGCVRLRRRGGLTVEVVSVDRPYIATLVPGVRGVQPGADSARVVRLRLDAPAAVDDAEVLEILPADPATIDLAEAARIVGAGVGLGSAEAVDLLRRVGLALGAATGGTRVVTDLGWLAEDRQIGTTGVAVDPRLYLAFGISGAVQHVAGLGRPDHVVSVNLDPACPMSALADLAVVADAPATLHALAGLLGVPFHHSGRAVDAATRQDAQQAAT
jgi:electron transfer flavoprotein alpha subunit